MIVAEISILLSSNTTDELAALYLQPKVVDLLPNLVVATEKANEENLKLREASNVGVEANGRIPSLEEVQRTNKRLLMESQAEVRRFTACVKGREKEVEALRPSEDKARQDLALDGRRSEDVASTVLLEKAGASDMLLSDPTRGGWRSRRDKEIEYLVPSCMTDISDSMELADSAKICAFLCVQQLAESVSGNRLLERCDLCNADGIVRRAGYIDRDDGNDGETGSGGAGDAEGASCDNGESGAAASGQWKNRILNKSCIFCIFCIFCLTSRYFLFFFVVGVMSFSFH